MVIYTRNSGSREEGWFSVFNGLLVYFSRVRLFLVKDKNNNFLIQKAIAPMLAVGDIVVLNV